MKVIKLRAECVYTNLINLALGPFWENIGPNLASSVQIRQTANILPFKSRANFVNKRFIA